MSTILIAENILDADDFNAATEQEGEHVGQPVPDSENTGAFRLLSKGDVEDFSYSGTATDDGAGDKTTVIDSVLSIYGDDYFISGIVTITSGAATGETKTITDFAQATGTITMAAFSTQIVTGVTFTLTVPFSSRDFRVELTGSGDVGDATFKWSHDGGTTYFGRDDPYDYPGAAYWPYSVIADISFGFRAQIVQADNDDLICFYQENNATPDTKYRISSDGGVTWGAEKDLSSDDFRCALKIKSGRILCFVDNNATLFYSDDNGQTFSSFPYAPVNVPEHVIETYNGELVAVRTDSGTIKFYKSTDGGVTFSDEIEVVNDANDQENPGIVQAQNGDLIAVYQSDEDVITRIEAKCKISTDGGVTWGSKIAIMDWSAGPSNRDYPHMIRDFDGTLYCIARKTTIIQALSKSIDNGQTWSAEISITPLLTDEHKYGKLALLAGINGPTMIVVFQNASDGRVEWGQCGMWEAYSSNVMACAPELIKQRLICNASIVWHGGGGISGDKWTVAPAYHYAMSNLIEDSPSFPWRSEQDGIACTIVLDMGANNRFAVSGVGFFGCNLRSFDFQMNATDSWDSPSIDQSISFDLTTAGVVDSVSGNVVVDAALMASYKDHALKGTFLRMLDGTDSGVTWKILDNVGDNIFLDTTASHNIAGADTFAIFQSNASKIFTEGVYQFIRISIDIQQTSDDFYQIGSMVAGEAISLTKSWAVGYQKDHQYNIEQLRTMGGGIVSIKRSDNVRKRIFTVTWPAADAVREEIAALLDYVEGKNITLIPDSDTLIDCYLVKLISDLSQLHRFNDTFEISAIFEENN